MKKIITILTGTLLLAACQKNEPKQYSHWKVDGIEYSSNDVRFDKGKAVAVISSRDPNNRFILTFYGRGYPTRDSIRLKRTNLEQDLYVTEFSFFVNNRYYGIDNNNTFLKADMVKGKVQYVLSTSWYSNFDNSIKDSVLIEAIINEP